MAQNDVNFAAREMQNVALWFDKCLISQNLLLLLVRRAHVRHVYIRVSYINISNYRTVGCHCQPMRRAMMVFPVPGMMCRPFLPSPSHAAPNFLNH